MNIKQVFANITSLKPAITAARAAAKEEAEQSCEPGMLVSRGAWIKAYDAAGNILRGEAESWEFKGTAAQFKELADYLRYDTKVAEVTIEGGWNWYANPHAYKEHDGEPWVSEWNVVFGTKEFAPAPAQEAPAQAPEGAKEASVADMRAETIGQFTQTLQRAEHELELAQALPVTYVVICETLPLKFDIVNNVADKPQLAKPWEATRFSMRDATSVAANTRNGNGTVGEVHTLVEAIEEEIKTLRQLLGALGAQVAV